MSFSYKELQGYLQRLPSHNGPILAEMERRAERDHFPIIGPVAGRFLYQVTRMLGARRVFELGSGYGYSTLWFAKAVQENGGGEVHHTVWDDGLSHDARGYLKRAGMDSILTFRVSEAVSALRSVDGPFDIIFNDIEKSGYPASIPLIKEKLRPGGALLIDNMLWHGQILNPDDREADTEAVRETTRLLFEDQDFTSTLIPLRDGVVLAFKR